MIRRLLTALIGIPLLVLLILYAGIPLLLSIVMLASLLALHEYYLLTQTRFAPAFSWAGYLIGFAILLSSYFRGGSLSLLLPSAAVLILMAELFSRRERKSALESTAFTLFGAWYVCGLMGYVVNIRMIDSGGRFGAHLLMLLFVIIWANDIFAYLAGKNFGRHPLAPQVSPKKTVEGAVAGFVFGVAAAVIYARFLIPDLTPIHAGILGGFVGAASQIGDLCESLLKRSANVKDSGNLLPGHGGVLDRIDSLLFGAPAMYYYCTFLLHK
jgi:phosphatidate cytidylyltransferase